MTAEPQAQSQPQDPQLKALREARQLSLLRSSTLLAITTGTVVIGFGVSSEALFTDDYFWHNRTPDPARLRLLLTFVSAIALGGIALPLLSLFYRKSERFPMQAHFWVRKLLPLGPLAIALLLFDWKIWQHHDQVLLLCVLVNALAMGAAVHSSFSTEALPVVAPNLAAWRAHFIAKTRFAGWFRRLLSAPRTWLVLTLLATAAYVSWFGYHTTVWHRSAWSSYDLAIEDNILYNLLHGGPFFKAAPTLGPTGSHFARHSTLVSYLLLPFYALHQSAETILILQSLLMGSAAIPLFLFARRRIGPGVALVVAVAYLMHPALQQSNLFEAHYVKFGLPFVWALLWLVDSGRNKWAIFFAALTLSVREDVAAWVVMIGLWAAVSGRSLRLGLGLTAGASIYVVLMKLVIMPKVGGGDSLMFMYQGLLPDGKTSFAWVLATALSNPSFVVNLLIEEQKLTFLAQLIVPLGLLPLRHRLGWFALIPGGIFCLLATKYPPLTDIHFQYSPHFLAFLFPALVFTFEAIASSHGPGAVRAERAKLVAILIMALVPTSYQFGAVLQGNTSRGGPIPYHFGWHEIGRERHRDVEALLKHLPRDARVAASNFLTPQVSARANAYSLWLGMYDAEWIIAPLEVHEYSTNEVNRVRDALNADWGVVAIEGQFMIARKGHEQSLNKKVLKIIGRKRIPHGKRATGYFVRPELEDTGSK